VLELRKGFLCAAAAALTLLLAAADLVRAAERPNILWLIAEDFGNQLGTCGTREVSTPNLDELAAEGVRYSRFFTTAPVCSPSRSAFMTGMYQTTIGAHHHRSHRDDGYPIPSGVRLLTDWFRDGKYFTANLRYLPAELGFQGTAKTDWNFTPPEKPFDSQRWADLKTHQPFYAQLNFQETHRPFHAPRQADPSRVEIPPYEPDHPIARADHAAYLDAATELDRKVGLVLEQLQTEGLADSTIVVFFGDNGQAHIRGKQFCYEEGLNVPLIIRWPKRFPTPGHFTPGTVDDRLLMAIDLAPTMLALAGLSVPEKMQGQVFLGDQARPPHDYVFGARDRCDETPFRFRTVRDTRYRYIRNFTPDRPFLQSNNYKETSYPIWNLLKELHAADALTPAQERLCAPSMPEEELYDLQTDPHEINNLAGRLEHRPALERLRRTLENWIEETNDQGRTPEPPELIRRQGATRPSTPPLKGYALPDPARPNVVFILADDLGWADLGCYGSSFYETPHLDRLAARGVRFTQAYAACPVCSPTRAAAMTGKYPARLHLTDFIGGTRRGKLSPAAYLDHLPLHETTVAEVFKSAGYTTGFVGKWHLGGQGFSPLDQGFGSNVAGSARGATATYFSPYKLPALRDGPEGEYLTDRLALEAVEFLREHRDRPFLLWFCPYAVHIPLQAKPELMARFEAKARRITDAARPRFRPEGTREDRRVQDHAVYAEMLASLDDAVGSIVKALDDLGIADRTLIVFTSDNGGLSTAEGSPTSNAPLRAGKGWLYEGGIRVPLIVQGPQIDRPGRTSEAPVVTTDLAATMMELAEGPDDARKALDGGSLLPLLMGRGTPERGAIFWHYPHYGNQGGSPGGAIRLGDWKLIEFYEDKRIELYNLEQDPGEQHDLAATEPVRVSELRQRLHAWRAALGAAMPTPNPDYRPPAATK